MTNHEINAIADLALRTLREQSIEDHEIEHFAGNGYLRKLTRITRPEGLTDAACSDIRDAIAARL